MKCQCCGDEVDQLINVSENLAFCRECYHETNAGGRKPQSELVTITMDSRMLRALEAQADVEGFSDVGVYIHTILFREAVAVYLEELGELEGLEQEAAFTRELRDWLVRR